MNRFLRDRRTLDVLALLPGLWLAGLVLVAFAGRLAHPFDLEWMEGGMLTHAWRISEWLPVYTEPDAEWIPYIYPPGYPAVVAALGKVFGLSMGLGRAVSVVASLTASALLVAAGQRLRNPLAGLVGATIYLSCFPCTGAFYDLIRPDALGLAFFAGSVLLGLGGPRARVGAGLLLAAAFMVKHNYASYGVAMALGIAVQFGWREALKFAAASALPALGFVAAVEIGSEGHFLDTILGIAGAHPMVYTRFFPGGVEEIGRHVVFVLAGVSVAFALLTAQATGHWRSVLGASALVAALSLGIGLQIDGVKNMASPWWGTEWGAWLGLGAGLGAVLGGGVGWFRTRSLDGRWVYGAGIAVTAFVTTGLMRAHHGGFLNVWMPLHWVLALGFVVAMAGLRARFSRPVEALLVVAALAHFYVRSDFDPRRYTPQAEDVEAGQAFVKLLEDCDSVLSPYAPWLPVYAGHDPSWHLIALWDVHHPAGPYRRAVRDVKAAAKEHRWACVINATGRPLGYGFDKHYQVWETPRPKRSPEGWVGPAPFMPKSGWRVRPRSILVPREL